MIDMTRRHRRITTLASTLVAFIAMATPGGAHQTVSSNGVSVTLHVLPDDQPIAGEPSTLHVLRVAVPKKAAFTLSKARVTIIDSSGRTLLSRAAAKRIGFTFPSAAAYRITVSGSYRRSGKTKRFATAFAIRADASQATNRNEN